MAEAFLGIDHIGVAVPNLEDAVATYRDLLGFAVEGGETLPERGLEVAFISTGAKQGTARIELIAPTRDDSEVSSFLHKRGSGVHHICVRVADIEAAVARLQSQGAQMASVGIRPGAHGSRVAFVHPKACQGVLLELVEHPVSTRAPKESP